MACLCAIPDRGRWNLWAQGGIQPLPPSETLAMFSGKHDRVGTCDLETKRSFTSIPDTLSSRKVFMKADNKKGSQPARPSNPTGSRERRAMSADLDASHVPGSAGLAWPLAFSHNPPPRATLALSVSGSCTMLRCSFLCPSLPDQPITMRLCFLQLFNQITQNVLAWGMLSSQ